MVRSLNRILLPLLAAAVLIAAVVAVALGGSGGRGAPVSTAGAQAGFDGAALPPGAPAPAFTLTDQAGRPRVAGRATAAASSCSRSCTPTAAPRAC